MTATAKFWDKVAVKYAKSPIRDMQSYEYSLERVRSYLTPNDRALELGCGTGSTAIRLAPHVAEILATDYSRTMLGIGRERAAEQGVTNVSFAQADVSNAPEGPFDVVMAFNLLHLLEDFEGGLTRIAGLVKPGGFFISKTICKPEQGAPLKFRLMMMIVPVMQLFGNWPQVRIRSIAEFESAIQKAGFDIIETGNYPAKPPSRFVVARKR